MSKQTTRKENFHVSGPGLILITIWAVGLLIAYLTYRGTDVGQITTLIGGLAHGSWFGGAGLLNSSLGLVIAIFVLLAWFGLGRTVVQLTGVLRDDSIDRWLNVANSTALGAALWSLVWFFLGLAGAYRRPVALAALLIGLGLAVWQLFGFVRQARAAPNSGKLSGGERILLGLSLVPVVLALIAALAPPTAKDSLFYHLALPQAFLVQGSNAAIEGNIASYFTLGTEMHSVWAMLLGNLINPRVAEASAGATLFLFFPLVLMAIYGWARELDVARNWSLLAVLLFASVPSAYYVAASAYIDVSLALYVILALYALGRWWKTLEPRWAVGLGIFLSAALSAKLTALFIFAAVGLVVLLRAREAKEDSAAVKRIFAVGAMALLVGGLLASPWYLRNWKTTGSPIFPFYLNIWKGQAPGWDVERWHLYQSINSHYGGDEKGAVDYLLTPVKILVLAQPEAVEFYDGVIGCVFLFGLPFLIWALWKEDLPVELKAALGVCLVMFLFWLFSSQLLRYLLPIFPVLAIAICAAGEAVGRESGRFRRLAQFSLAVLAVAGVMTSVAWFLHLNPVRVVMGGEARADYLARNLDYYSYYQYLNAQTPPDAKVWLINMRRDTYNLERPYFSDFMFEDWTLKQMVWEARETADLRARIRAMGISYILVRHDVLLDYAHSSIVDDKKTNAENEAKLKMMRELFFDGANTIRSEKRFSLVRMGP